MRSHKVSVCLKSSLKRKIPDSFNQLLQQLEAEVQSCCYAFEINLDFTSSSCFKENTQNIPQTAKTKQQEQQNQAMATVKVYSYREDRNLD